jgi:hypothetical protein
VACYDYGKCFYLYTQPYKANESGSLDLSNENPNQHKNVRQAADTGGSADPDEHSKGKPLDVEHKI